MTDPTPLDPDELRRRAQAIFDGLIADLAALVRIPSISSQTYDPGELDRSAAAVAELLRGAGMPEVEILSAGGAPAVLARRPAPAGAPTVLLYAHHDVQPTGPEADWETAPFEPTRRGDRLYGRGAADDKAGVIAHVGALRLLGADVPVGVTVFVEGEEEVGSPTFAAFLREHADRLAADVVVLADSVNWKVGVPGITTSLRGVVSVDVEVRVLEHAVHSGMFGGPVLDAVTLLARLVATLHDDAGEVAVAGLHRAPDPSVDYPAEELRRDAGVLDGVRLAGSGPLAARLWTRPAIAVIGMDVPDIAHSANTITPAARARLSLRVAPGQEPADALAALRAHLEAHAPFGAQVTLADGELGRPFQAAGESAAVTAARWAFTQAWGTAPVDMGLGGSIPLVADLLDAFPETAVLITGVEDPDSRAHSANESVHLGELERVVLAEALLLARLGGVAGPGEG